MPATSPRLMHGFAHERMIVLPERVIACTLREPAACGLAVASVGHFPDARYHYIDRPAGVHEHVVIYCTHGRGFAQLDQSRLPVTPGSLILLPPDRHHLYGSFDASTWTIYWMHLRGSAVETALRRGLVTTALGRSSPPPAPQPQPPAPKPAHPPSPSPHVIHPGHDLMSVSLFEEILTTLLHRQSPPALLLACAAARHLLTRLLFHGTAASQSAPHPPVQRIAGVIELMRQQLTTSLRVADLARAANLSIPHFNLLFRRRTGRSPIAFFNQLRMRHAATLLASTDRPIKSIAQELGYDDPLYFSRRFTAEIGMAPSRYRHATRTTP